MTEQTKSVILSLLVLGGGVYLAYLSFKPKPFKGEAKETIALLVSRTPLKSGSANYYQFLCNGKTVRGHGGSSIAYSVLGGEKYRALYDSLNCENWILKRYQPVFLADEETENTIGKITNTSSIIIGKPYIKFKYQVNGIEYKRLQYMEEKGFQEKYPEIKKGAEFRVEYWLENPQRSIMHFKK